MMKDKYIEQLLNLYFKGKLSQEEKDRLFESIRSNPSLNDTIQFVLSHTDPAKVELFLSERSLMCDTQLISEEDETLIELYLSGMMSQEEETDFMDKLVSDEDLLTNALAQAFLVKAIQKIHNADNKVLDAAKHTSTSDVKSLFKELHDEDDDMLIESYLKDNLSEDERKAFEERLKSDKDFRERVSATAILSKSIIERQERDAKAIEDAKRTSIEDIISTIKGIDTPAATTIFVAGSTGKMMPLWIKRVASVAAVVLLVAGVGLDYHNSVVMRENAEQCVLFAESNLSDENFRGEGDDVRKELRLLLENVKKRENLSPTIEKLEVYYTNTLDDTAHIEDTFADQISFALASAYILDGQNSKAKEVLNHIMNDPEASPEVKKKARKLLDSIKKTFIF